MSVQISKEYQNEDEISEILSAFMPYIRRRASRVKRIGFESDDIIQEGLIGLFKAITSYDETKAAFSTYAITCIDNGIASALKESARKKNIPLNTSISMEDEDPPSNEHSPLDITIIRDEYSKLVGRISKNLSQFERDVLALYLDGYSYLVMAELLHTNSKSVDNALQRARQKLKPV